MVHKKARVRKQIIAKGPESASLIPPASDHAQILTLDVRSEFKVLEAVMLHRPGREIERLTPANKGKLLFEDMPYLRLMQKEHKAFAGQLTAEGVRVLYIEDLLLELLEQNAEAKNRIVTQACALSLLPALADILLDGLSLSRLRDVLISGITRQELKEEVGVDLADHCGPGADQFLLGPVPNLYFMRDPAAIVGNGIVSCKMHYRARVRESFLVQQVLRSHPLFATPAFFFGGPTSDGQSTEDRPLTIEGGDIIVLSDKALAVGCSERTRSETVRRLAQRVFQSGVFQRVYEITIPSRREYMHLDTVFTVVDRGMVVTYPEVMDHVVEVRRYEPLDMGTVHAVARTETRDFKTILEAEFGCPLTVVTTGDGDLHHAEREQAADGTNVLAIAPRRVITYDRNPRTNEALRRAGVQVIEIEGSELVRGLGGPRCMTMPLRRAT